MLKNNDRKIKLSLLVLDLPSFKLLTVTRFVTKSLIKKKEWEDFIIFVFVLDMIKI